MTETAKTFGLFTYAFFLINVFVSKTKEVFNKLFYPAVLIIKKMLNIINRRLPLLAIPLLLILFMPSVFAGGHETFDNLNEGGSYSNGSFIGQDGGTWTYVQCRGDFTITDTSIMIGSDRDPQSNFYSDTISGGIGEFSFKYMQAYATNVDLEAYINDSRVASVTTSSQQSTILTSDTYTVNIEGDFVIKFINRINGAGQVCVDDIIWTQYPSDNPQITITSPADSHDTTVSSITVSGITAYSYIGDSVELWLNDSFEDTYHLTSDSGSWDFSGVNLTSGANYLNVRLISGGAAVAQDTITVTRWDTPSIAITLPANNHDTTVQSITVSGTTANIAGAAADTMEIFVGATSYGGVTISSENGSWMVSGVELSGSDSVWVELTDQFGRKAYDTITVNYSPPNYYIEDFEDDSKGSYAVGTVSLRTGTWTFDEALIGSLANDKKNGSQSARIQQYTTDTASITSPEFAAGVKAVSFEYARYGTDNAVNLVLEYTTNGSDWNELGSVSTSGVDALTNFTVNTDISDPAQFRIRCSGGSSGDRANVDDFKVYYVSIPEVAITFPEDGHDTSVGTITVSGTTAYTAAGDTIELFVNGVSQGGVEIAGVNGSWTIPNVTLTDYGDSVWVKLTVQETYSGDIDADYYDTITVNYIFIDVGDIVVSEIMYGGIQYIELYNRSAKDLVIGSCYLTKNSGSGASTIHTFSGSDSMPSGTYLLLLKYTSAMTNHSNYNYVTNSSLSLDTAVSEIIGFYTSEDVEIDTAGQAGGTWFGGSALDNGYAMERIDVASAGYVASNWRNNYGAPISTVYNGRAGTPGEARGDEKRAIGAGEVIISEVMWGGTGGDYVEIYNTLAGTPLSLHYLGLGSNPDTNNIYSFAYNDTITAGGFFVAVSSKTAVSDAAIDTGLASGMDLNAAGEYLQLVYLSTTVDTVDASGGWFEGSADGAGVAMEREATRHGSNSASWHDNNKVVTYGGRNGTPGYANSNPLHLLISTVYINAELNPTEGDEFFEIYNPTADAITLSDGSDTYYIKDHDGNVIAFPLGTEIAAGDTFVVAKNAHAFYTVFGFAPPYEWYPGSSAYDDVESSENMLLVSGTLSGFVLRNTADILAIYKQSDASVSVDVLVWGSSPTLASVPEGTFTGTKLTVPAEGFMLKRTPGYVEGTEVWDEALNSREHTENLPQSFESSLADPYDRRTTKFTAESVSRQRIGTASDPESQIGIQIYHLPGYTDKITVCTITVTTTAQRTIDLGIDNVLKTPATDESSGIGLWKESGDLAGFQNELDEFLTPSSATGWTVSDASSWYSVLTFSTPIDIPSSDPEENNFYIAIRTTENATEQDSFVIHLKSSNFETQNYPLTFPYLDVSATIVTIDTHPPIVESAEYDSSTKVLHIYANEELFTGYKPIVWPKIRIVTRLEGSEDTITLDTGTLLTQSDTDHIILSLTSGNAASIAAWSADQQGAMWLEMDAGAIKDMAKIDNLAFDTIPLSVKETPVLYLNEINIRGNDWFELYVPYGGNGELESGWKIVIPNYEFEIPTGITGLSTGDYLVVYDDAGTSDSGASPAGSWWQIYTGGNELVLGMDNTKYIFLYYNDKLVDAVFFSYQQGNDLTPDMKEKANLAAANNKWSIASSTPEEYDLIGTKNGFPNNETLQRYKVSLDSANDINDGGKYFWDISADSSGGAVNDTSSFFNSAGKGITPTITPEYVYKGADSITLTINITNDTTWNRGIIAFEGIEGLSASSRTGSDSSYTTTNAKDAGDTYDLRLIGDTLILGMKSDFSISDTIAVVYGSKAEGGSGLTVPSDTGSYLVKLYTHTIGNAVLPSVNEAHLKVVDIDTIVMITPADKYFVENKLGTQDEVVVEVRDSDGNAVYGAPVVFTVMSRLDGDSETITAHDDYSENYSSQTSYSITCRSDESGRAGVLFNTDAKVTGENKLQISVGALAVTFTDSTTQPSVVINEVSWAQGIGADGYQFIELYNLTGSSIDLTNYYITASDGTLVPQAEFNGKTIGAYEYFIITPNDDILSDISADLVASTNWTSSLSLDGENLTLYKDTDEIEDEALCGNGVGWYAGDGTNKYSMERINPTTAGDSSSNWLASTGTYTYGGGAGRGSPGAANTVSILDSIISGGIATADGSSTAPVSVVLKLDNSNPVKNHWVRITTTFGTLTDASGSDSYGQTHSYVTNDTGQIFTYVKSASSGIGTITAQCTQTTVTALPDEGTVRFLNESGLVSDDGGEYTASVSSVDTIDSSTDAGPSGSNFIVSPVFNKTGTHLAYIQGDFTTIKDNPGSDRAIYKYDISTGEKVRLTPRSFNPSPHGLVGWTDVDGDGNEDVLFTGWITAYDKPFWCVMWAKADGSDSENDVYPDARNLHPSNTTASVHWADITNNGHTIDEKEYNVVASVNGRLVVYPSEWAEETEYFSRGSDVQKSLLHGLQTDNQKYMSYYWADVRWDKTGNRIVMTRLDLRELFLKESHGFGHSAATNIFQSEIWMLKNVSDHIGNPIDPIVGHPDLIRVSPQTIADTEKAGTDGIYGNTDDPSDTIYMMPAFSRGNVVTYAVDQTGSFNTRTLMTLGPNTAFNGTDFNVIMRYVGTENYIDNACTYPEVRVTYDTGNQFSLNWSFAGDANMAMLTQNPNNSDKLDLKIMELESQSYIDENGGIIFDNGVVTAVVPAGSLATGTVLSTKSSLIDGDKEVYSDTMVASGAAREFFPHGVNFSDSVQLIIHYNDDDLAAVGISPGSPEEAQLKVFYWNGDEWVDYGGIVNTTDKTITIITDHFSKYALFIVRDPHPLKSTINTDKPTVNADGIEYAELTVKLLNADTLPLKGLKVKVESSRSAYDTIVYVNERTNDSGEVKVRVYSSAAGKSEFKVKNLGNRFTDTVTVEFALPKDGSGLIVFDDFPELTMYVPASAFDTEVIIKAAPPSQAKKEIVSKAKQKEKLIRNAVWMDEIDTIGIYEINIYRKSDSALMNNALKNSIEMRYYPQNGGIDIITLRFMYLNEAKEEWVELETEISQDNSYVYYNASHFSIYSIASVSADSVVGSVKDAIVYPNPWRADRHSSNARYGVKFVLPKDREIEIQLFNIAGQRIVWETVNTSTDWVYRWDLTNSRGRRAASGIYIYVIHDKNTGERKTGKTAVIR